MVLVFCFCSSAILSFWRHVITFYGFECSFSEPDLPKEDIIRRSEKLFFSNLWNAILYIIKFFYTSALFYQLYKCITFPSFISMENVPAIALLIAGNLLFLLLIQYVKTKMYIVSLLKYYNKITFNKEKYLDLFNKYYTSEPQVEFVEYD
jgi:hypothetical protein